MPVNHTSVLIVEDEAINAMLIQLELKKAGIPVCGVASSGRKAIEIAAENKPGIIIMDIRLSGSLDGLETAEKLSIEYPAQFIFISGYDLSGMLPRIHSMNTLAVCEKPIHMKKIIRYINEAV